MQQNPHPLQKDFIKLRLASRRPKSQEKESWSTTLRILLSSPKYLNLNARCSSLSALIESNIPAADDGIVLEIADWHTPLLGACLALGVDATAGQLTTARPTRLGTVRTSNGDAAEGDGLRREWFHKAVASLLEPDRGLFKPSADETTLVPNSYSGTLVPDHLAQFALFGRIMGLALLHQETIPRIGDLNVAVFEFLLGKFRSNPDR